MLRALPLAAALRTLTPPQRNAILAAYLGWTLDAFDFFLLVFLQGAIARSFGTTPLMLDVGGFLVQAAMQGAWGVVPVHLNELSPSAARAFFPGFAYRLGNLLTSRNAPVQAAIAKAHGGNYGFALAVVAGVTALVLATLAALGPERRDVDFVAEAKGG